MSEMRPVKPFPHIFCEDCMINGCYPWNDLILLCCSEFGGLIPQMIEYDEELKQAVRCLCYKPVTEKVWQRYFKGLREEAEGYEDLRKKAMDGEVHTNQTLPEHIFLKEKVKVE